MEFKTLFKLSLSYLSSPIAGCSLTQQHTRQEGSPFSGHAQAFAVFADLLTICLHLGWASASLHVGIVPIFQCSSQMQPAHKGRTCQNSKGYWGSFSANLHFVDEEMRLVEIEWCASVRGKNKTRTQVCWISMLLLLCGIIELLNYHLTRVGIHLPVPLLSHSHLLLLILYHSGVHLLQ